MIARTNSRLRARVILMGYPQADEFGGNLAASVGRILGDAEAENAIRELSDLGDEEGAIAYDSEVEMIIEGHAVVGMSGGGVCACAQPTHECI